MEHSIKTTNTLEYTFLKALDANFILTEEQKKQILSFCYYHVNDFPIPMHSHEFYEINIVVEGTGKHYIENNSIPITRGDFFVIPPNILHGYSEKNDLNIFHLILSDKFFAKYQDELRSIYGYSLLFDIEPRLRAKNNLKIFPNINASDFMFLLSEISKLHKLNQYTDKLLEAEKSIKSLNLIFELIATVTTNEYNTQPRAFADIKQITRVMNYIDGNFNSKITLKELCDISNMSRSSLLAQFHTLCNCSPAEYLLQVRIDNARKLLTETEMSVATVAQECGFYDSSHFTKAFYQKTNLLPKDFRKSDLRE